MDVQICAVQLGDARDDGHAEPDSVTLLWIDPKEALTQARQSRSGNAGACIADIDPDPIALLLHLDRDLALDRGVTQRVVDEVAEHQIQQCGLTHYSQVLGPLQ